MSTIEFQDECRYNPERNSVEFQASEDGRALVCEIVADALEVRLGSLSADETACVAAVRQRRSEIQKIAERIIRIGAITGSGCVLISKAMLEN